MEIKNKWRLFHYASLLIMVLQFILLTIFFTLSTRKVPIPKALEIFVIVWVSIFFTISTFSTVLSVGIMVKKEKPLIIIVLILISILYNSLMIIAWRLQLNSTISTLISIILFCSGLFLWIIPFLTLVYLIFKERKLNV
ncbi:hypothetical protein [Mycoplasma sp. 5370]